MWSVGKVLELMFIFFLLKKLNFINIGLAIKHINHINKHTSWEDGLALDWGNYRGRKIEVKM